MRKIKTFTEYVDSEYCKRYWVTFDGVNNDGGKVGVYLFAWSGKNRPSPCGCDAAAPL